MSKAKWHFRVRREAPLFPAYSVTESLAHTDKALELPFNYQNIRYVNYDWLFLMSEEKELEKLMEEKVNTNLNYFHDYVKRQYNAGENLKKYVKQISDKQSPDFASELKTYVEKMREFYSFWWLAVPAGKIVENKAKKILAKHGFSSSFGDLIHSSQILELSKEQIALLKMAKEIKGKQFNSLSKQQQNKLQKHAERFRWLSTSYHLGEPQSVESLFEKIQTLNPDKELKEIEQREENYSKLMKLLKEKLDKSQLEVIQVMQEIIFSRNYQKETVNECQHRSEPFLKKCAEKIGVSWNEFLYFTPQEAVKAMAGRIVDSNIIAARKKGYAVVIENESCFVTLEVKKYVVKPEERDDFQIVSEIIKGQPGCVGKARGIVRVIMSKDELDSFKQGEILVTSMTSIDFVPVMKKAAAIVTNEGGITCHAAIVSRELNIPCVIGTKIATKALKNGDEVEVDATKGIVRKL